MSLTRKRLHQVIDEKLDELGYGETILIQYGKIGIEISFQDGKETIVLKERETSTSRVDF